MSKFPLTENISRLWSSLIVDELAKSGINQFYCAPGMRNAPILAAANYHKDIKTYGFLDERALSYRALGSAKFEQSIPVLSCTSGTAVANFLPAVIEAYRSSIPMIIISADRPIELVKIDANQTIDQTTILKDFTCHTLFLEAPSNSLTPLRLRSLISSAVGKARMYKRPVHINLPLREPLDASPIKIETNFFNEAISSFKNQLAKNTTSRHQTYQSSQEVTELIKEAKSPLLVVGKLERLDDLSSYSKALKKINIPKFIDVTSGIKYNFSLKDKLSPSFDHPEVFEAYTKKKPDLIIHIGGRLVSKHYYRYQEENPEIQIIHITNVDTNHDPGFSNNLKIVCDPLSFINSVASFDLDTPGPIDWESFTNRKREIIENGELSFPFLSKNIIENISAKTQLLIGNSTAIRSFDSYIHPSESSEIRAFSNRGVSGIEGFISTLVGMSDSNKQPKVLVLGDISFIYDLNSLYMLNSICDVNLTVVIVNNYGGGIFELLPISEEKEIMPLLTTPHNDSFEKLISAFSQIHYKHVVDKCSFVEVFKDASKNEGIDFIEVSINTLKNKKVYDKLKTVKL